jgi:hypothetical protein
MDLWAGRWYYSRILTRDDPKVWDGEENRMAEQVWASGPPAVSVARRGRYDWAKIAADLRARPGEWLLVSKDAGLGVYSAIKRDKMTDLRSTQWEYLAATRNNDRTTGTCELWMSAVKREDS